MAKYKNKDTGVIVEAMQIEYSCQDILDFGGGLIRSIQSTGLLSRRMDTFDLEINREYASPWHFICKTGDYLVKKDTSIFALCEKEFKKCFELTKGENDMQNKEYTIGEVLEFPIGTEFTIKDGGIVKIVGCDDDKCKKLVLIDKYHKIYDECKLTNLWMEKKFKLVGADKRTITKDIFDPVENAKVGMGLTAKLNIDLEKGIKLLDEIETNSGDNKDINVTIDCISKDDTKKTKEYIAHKLKDITAETQGTSEKERTVRDCILDMIIEEKAEGLREKLTKYINGNMNDLNSSMVHGGSCHSIDGYKKLVDGKKQLRQECAENLLKYKEKDICKLLGFGPNKTFKYLMEDVNQYLEFEKEKDDEQNI